MAAKVHLRILCDVLAQHAHSLIHGDQSPVAEFTAEHGVGSLGLWCPCQQRLTNIRLDTIAANHRIVDRSTPILEVQRHFSVPLFGVVYNPLAELGDTVREVLDQLVQEIAPLHAPLTARTAHRGNKLSPEVLGAGSLFGLDLELAINTVAKAKVEPYVLLGLELVASLSLLEGGIDLGPDALHGVGGIGTEGYAGANLAKRSRRLIDCDSVFGP